MAGRRRKLSDKDLAIKLTGLALDGINLTWSAVVLSEPYHRVRRVAQEWSVPYANSVLMDGDVRIERRPWTAEDDRIVMDRDRTASEISQLLHRSTGSVYSRRYSLQRLQERQGIEHI